MKLDLLRYRQKGEESLGAVNKRPKPAHKPKDEMIHVKPIMFNESFSGTFASNVSLIHLIEDLKKCRNIKNY